MTTMTMQMTKRTMWKKISSLFSSPDCSRLTQGPRGVALLDQDSPKNTFIQYHDNHSNRRINLWHQYFLGAVERRTQGPRE